MVSFFRLGDVNDNEEKNSQKVSERAETPGCFELLIVTAKQMRKKKQFLLIPLTIWSGLEQGFFGADFTAVRYLSDAVQDFLNKLGMKPCMHLVEIGIFSLNLVIIRLAKILNRADKTWTQF